MPSPGSLDDLGAPPGTALAGAGAAAADLAPPPTVIRPAPRWKALNLRELWEFRELVGFLTWRDVKVRYKQTLLGAAWAIMQPTMFAIVFAFFINPYAHFPAGGTPYFLFVFAGMLPWSFFANAITLAGQSVVQAERVITKVYFPRLSIPFASVGASLVDFALAFIVLIALMVWYGIMPTWQIILLPFAVGILAVAALGIGSLLAALMVAYRDIRFVMPFLIQLLLFATPGIYMDTDLARAQAHAQTAAAARSDVVPHGLMDFHPIDGAIGLFRASILGTDVPWRRAAYATVIVLGLFYAGCIYFRRVEDAFADII